MLIDRRLITQFDWPMLALVTVIPLLGLIILYSAGYESEATTVSLTIFDLELFSPIAFRQTINLAIGFGALIAGLLISPKLLYRYAVGFYIGGVLLLVLVIFFGEVINGARRWIDFGLFKLQPSELMKFAMIIMMARMLSKIYGSDTGAQGIKRLFLPTITLLIPSFLILIQPDLGTALAVLVTGSLMILYGGVKWRLLAMLAIIPLIALTPVQITPYQPAAIKLLKPYQQRRVMALFDPTADIQGSGWHIHQSKIAVGSGQVFGKGFLQGSQSQLRFLPEHTTDFIFSVLAEEWGFTGCALVLLLYGLLIYRIIYIAGRARDPFLNFLAFGVAAHLFFHVFVNIGMVVGLMPVVGLPLPLFSYGGSSVVATLFAIGLAMGVAMRRNQTLNPGL